MATAFDVLLEATLQHLADLKSQGVPFVEVGAETMARFRPATPAPNRPAPIPKLTPVGARPSPASASQRQDAAAVLPAPTRATGPTAPLPPPRALVPLPAGVGAEPPRVESKAAEMDRLRERALGCQLCPHLVKSRTQVVFGVGSLEAELMFVGEAPGADEDRLGEPFVGRAGQLLTRIIVAMGLSRATVYIGNVLKCRPDIPPGSPGNRAPRPEEMDTCKPYLVQQIEIIRPKVIVALGATAVQGLLNLRTTLGSVRGRWQDFRGTPVMPTYHPSYLLRAEDGPDRGFRDKRKTWEDMLMVLERLGHPISDKMRGHFLQPRP